MNSVILMGDPRVAAVAVVECGDDVIDTRALEELQSTPDENPQNPSYAFLRRSVADRLQAAQSTLPDGIYLLLTEGYRPYEQQAMYFNRRKQRFMTEDPQLSEEDAALKTSAFVSPPDVAPHVSGAAVDLTLIDDAGRRLDMGTAIDVGPEESAGACYFDAENITAEARENRDLLARALSHVGLVNYPSEWWHWSFGDRYWALMTGQPHAIYGPVQVTTEARTGPTA